MFWLFGVTQDGHYFLWISPKSLAHTKRKKVGGLKDGLILFWGAIDKLNVKFWVPDFSVSIQCLTGLAFVAMPGFEQDVYRLPFSIFSLEYSHYMKQYLANSESVRSPPFRSEITISVLFVQIHVGVCTETPFHAPLDVTREFQYHVFSLGHTEMLKYAGAQILQIFCMKVIDAQRFQICLPTFR